MLGGYHNSDGTSKLVNQNITISFAAVSEEPVVRLVALTGLEFTNSTVDGSDHQVANTTFSIADASVYADAKIEVKAADGVRLCNT